MKAARVPPGIPECLSAWGWNYCLALGAGRRKETQAVLELPGNAIPRLEKG